jgi:hypothetical protein
VYNDSIPQGEKLCHAALNFARHVSVRMDPELLFASLAINLSLSKQKAKSKRTPKLFRM